MQVGGSFRDSLHFARVLRFIISTPFAVYYCGSSYSVLKPVQHTVSLSRRFYVYIAVLWIFAVLTTALLQILDEFTDTFTRHRLVSRTLNQTSETTPFSNLRIPSKFALLTASPRYNLLTVTEKKNFSE